MCPGLCGWRALCVCLTESCLSLWLSHPLPPLRPEALSLVTPPVEDPSHYSSLTACYMRLPTPHTACATLELKTKTKTKLDCLRRNVPAVLPVRRSQIPLRAMSAGGECQACPCLGSGFFMSGFQARLSGCTLSPFPTMLHNLAALQDGHLLRCSRTSAWS